MRALCVITYLAKAKATHSSYAATLKLKKMPKIISYAELRHIIYYSLHAYTGQLQFLLFFSPRLNVAFSF